MGGSLARTILKEFKYLCESGWSGKLRVQALLRIRFWVGAERPSYTFRYTVA
jgi:hypothetical protein